MIAHPRSDCGRMITIGDADHRLRRAAPPGFPFHIQVIFSASQRGAWRGKNGWGGTGESSRDHRGILLAVLPDAAARQVAVMTGGVSRLHVGN